MDKIAILILAHKNPTQLSHLVARLDCSHFDLFIHVDSKSEIRPFMDACSTSTSKLVWVRKRIDTNLMTFSLIDATMSCVTEAISCHQDYKYYILITGQDYPIKSNNYIYDTLMSSYPMDFIDMYGLIDARNHGVQWVEHLGHSYFSQRLRHYIRKTIGNSFYFSPRGKIVKAPAIIYDKFMSHLRYTPRKAIAKTEYTYSAGSHFWTLTDTSIMFIKDRYENDKHINSIFRHTPVPEESYFQTILSAKRDLRLPEMYDQFKSAEKKMDNPALRLIKWYENGVHTSGHPALWKKEDFAFIQSAKALFARKFDENTDIDIYTLIDKSDYGQNNQEIM